MAEPEDDYLVGYARPPRDKRFERGTSGNPKGRPKGSRNAATILDDISRVQVKVTENGRTKVMSKFEAALTQLVNKAAAGDLKALRELHCWRKSFAEAENLIPPAASDEKHRTGIAILLKRLGRVAEPQDEKTDATPTETPKEKA